MPCTTFHPYPVFPDILILTGVSVVSWLLPPIVRLYTAGCKACLLSFKTKKETGVSNRDITSLMDGGTYTSEARSWSDTPPWAAVSRQDKTAVYARAQGDDQ